MQQRYRPATATSCLLPAFCAFLQANCQLIHVRAFQNIPSLQSRSYSVFFSSAVVAALAGSVCFKVSAAELITSVSLHDDILLQSCQKKRKRYTENLYLFDLLKINESAGELIKLIILCIILTATMRRSLTL